MPPLAAASTLSFLFLSFLSSGPFITFHVAPQLAVGSSDTLIVCLVFTVGFCLGGKAGGGRDGKPGGSGTTKPDCFNTIVE